VPPLNLVGDFGGGGMMLAYGMVAALLGAQRTGKGQVVDCAMTEGSAVLMSMIFSLRATGVWHDERGTNIIDSGSHYYDAYETADGKYFSVGAVEPQFYRQLVELLGLADDPAFAAQNDQRAWPALKEKVAARFKTKSRAEWTAIFDGTDACVAPVMSLDEAADHPHNRARNAFVDVAGVRQPAPAPRYSVTVADHPAPMASGAGVTESILTNAGIAIDDIAGLRAAGIVG
jgi:alpha-methylacyl-CoA racemase